MALFRSFQLTRRYIFPESFANRYPNCNILENHSRHAIQRCFRSWANILENKIFTRLVSGYDFMRYATINDVIIEAHAHTCEEIGASRLIDINSIRDFDTQNLVGHVLHWIVADDIPPNVRVSFLEHIVQAFLMTPNFGYLEQELTESINKPLDRAGLSIKFRNGQFVVIDDDLISSEIDRPLWSALAKPGLENTHEYLERAIMERDKGIGDPALSAAKALESVLGRIIEVHDIETKRNGGAAHLLDKICQFGLISDWEREMFKSFYRDVRNPLSHGAAGQIPVLSNQQNEWAIRFCIIAIARLLSCAEKS